MATIARAASLQQLRKPAAPCASDIAHVAPPFARRPARRTAGTLSPTQQQARAERITENLSLVRYVVGRMRRYADQNPLLAYEDLLAYGAEGLIAAVDTFEPERGLQFSTWAVMKIRTTILDALRALDPLPRSLRLKSRAIDQTAADLAHRTGQWPRRAEIATLLGEPLAQFDRDLQEISRSTLSLSLDRPRQADQEDESHALDLYDLLADADPASDPAATAERRTLYRLLATAVAALPAREQLLITQHYGDGRSLQALSVQMGVCPSRISQLHARALRRLRAHLQAALADTTPVADAARHGPPTSLRPLRHAA